MKVMNYKEAELKAEKAAKGAGIRWLLSERDGETEMAMRVIEIEAGGQTPDHSHSWEHQVFMLKGEGRVTVEGETRDIGHIRRPGRESHLPQRFGRDHGVRLHDSRERHPGV